LKKLTALAMLALTMILIEITPANAQTNKDVQRLAKVERAVNKIGVDENIKVTLLDGTSLKGHINAIGPDFFVVIEEKTANPQRINFVQVKQVKSIADNPLGDPAVLLGLALIPMILVFSVLAKGN